MLRDARLPERFWAKVSPEPTSGCWLWTAATSDGYGRFVVRRSDGTRHQGLAHRIAYEALVGNVPQELQLDHLCRNRACCNPSHLEAVTCRENLLRGETLNAAMARKTHCLNGHPFSGSNLIRNILGRRVCRACTLVRKREWQRRRARERGAW